MKNKIRVLHVEDNFLDRQLVKDALCNQSDAFEIIEADSREKFEQSLRDNYYDVVLSDFNILGFDGLQVLQVVKEKFHGVPVILLTGTGSEEVAIQAMKMGASDYVIKTVNHIKGLAHTIHQVLEKNRLLTEKVQALEALKESESRYRGLFENMQDLFFQVNEQGIITEITPSVYRLAGYPRVEVIGRPFTSLYHDLNEYASLVELIDQRGEVWDFEMRLQTKTGKVKYVSVNARLLPVKNQQQHGIEGSIRDIDERKRMEFELVRAKEKAEECDSLKTSFLHNISHEIRTPLNAIVGFSAIIADTTLPANKRKEFSEIILASSDQLLNIISDIITFSTIEAGQEKLVLNAVNINEKCTGLYKQFSPSAKKNGILFRFNARLPEGDEVFLVDELKFLQVLSNLLDNAFKFTRGGHVFFGCELLEKHLKFYVEDSGIGVPVEFREVIFSSFRKAETKEIYHPGGSGLGLSISKAFVEMHGGSIWFESEVNKGSIFYFTLPRLKEINHPKAVSLPGELPGLKSYETKTLLVVEDVDSNYLYIELILADTNFLLIRAKDGSEAIAICESTPGIDLVLMDIKMPVMDGYEATRRIKNIRPELPVIAQTAYATVSDKQKAFDCGCSDYISKPFKGDDLKVLIMRQFNWF